MRDTFNGYLQGIRENLNDGISEDDAIGMLSQHLVTKPVFDAVFGDFGFVSQNSVSKAMQSTIEALDRHGLENETADLDAFYRDVRTRVRGLRDPEARQRVVKELYERFISLALPEAADSLGIVYTPIEVVDYVVRSVEDLLRSEFDASLSDPGVHVLDPFTGTGTFITRLIQSGLIAPDDLPRKYESELHANEFLLLAYYIAAINIETAYHDAVGATAAESYTPFDGIVLTDTFEQSEVSNPMDHALFPHNNRRIERQKHLDIRVILGNPPWSATDNREYLSVDQRVKETYADTSSATLREALYDPYVKAIRQASDRVLGSDRGGIVAFVTNGGFIDGMSFDGFRKAIAEEFDAIYCYNLRGDQRTSGELSRREAGKIFGSGSRLGVAILFLVKKPGESSGATIHYRDIGDYLSREDKLEILTDSSLKVTDWQAINPNGHGDWINQRSHEFAALRPLVAADDGTADIEPIFQVGSVGLVTRRDQWVWNSSETRLRTNIERTVEFYERTRRTLANKIYSAKQKDRIVEVKTLVGKTPSEFHWNPEAYRDIANGEAYEVEGGGFTVGVYRPFFKQHVYL